MLPGKWFLPLWRKWTLPRNNCYETNPFCKNFLPPKRSLWSLTKFKISIKQQFYWQNSVMISFFRYVRIKDLKSFSLLSSILYIRVKIFEKSVCPLTAAAFFLLRRLSCLLFDRKGHDPPRPCTHAAPRSPERPKQKRDKPPKAEGRGTKSYRFFILEDVGFSGTAIWPMDNGCWAVWHSRNHMAINGFFVGCSLFCAAGKNSFAPNCFTLERPIIAFLLCHQKEITLAQRILYQVSFRQAFFVASQRPRKSPTSPRHRSSDCVMPLGQ